MEKLVLVIIAFILISCKGKKESCIERLIDEEGYSYEQAQEACDEMAEDSEILR